MISNNSVSSPCVNSCKVYFSTTSKMLQLHRVEFILIVPQQTFISSKSIIETLEKGVKYVQSLTIKTVRLK